MYEIGNAWDSSAITNGVKNGWFVGTPNFIEGGGLRQSQVTQMKWFKHEKGQVSGEDDASGKPRGASKGRTLSILVKGKFVLWFHTGDGNWVKHTLKQKGDYAIWGEGVFHKWKAAKKSVVMTVRWQEANP